MDAGIVITPIVREVVSAGKAVLLRLTDSAELAIHRCTKIGISVMQQQPGIGELWLAVTVPMHFSNLSKFHRCLLSCFSMEMVGMGEKYTPFDGELKLIGDFRVSSLDFIEHEARAVGKFLSDRSAENQIEIDRVRATGRGILESVVLDPGQMETTTIEFRCRLGEEYPERFEGRFLVTTYADISFPNVLGKEKGQLLEFEHQFNIDLSLNSMEITSSTERDVETWENTPALGVALKWEKLM